MTTNEICSIFRGAADKKSQIEILADMTDSDRLTIIEILKDNGLCVRRGKCPRCGHRLPLYTYCRDCENAIASERAWHKHWRQYLKGAARDKENRRLFLERELKQDEEWKRHIAWVIKENETRIVSLKRKLKEIENTEKLFMDLLKEGE